MHPGGPYWAKKDAGAWSIPKGLAEPDELGPEPATATAAKARNRAAGADLLAVARRETREETGLEPEGPFQPLGGVKAHGHKLIFAWAVEHDCDADGHHQQHLHHGVAAALGHRGGVPGGRPRRLVHAWRRRGRPSCPCSAGSSTTSRSSRPPAPSQRIRAAGRRRRAKNV